MNDITQVTDQCEFFLAAALKDVLLGGGAVMHAITSILPVEPGRLAYSQVPGVTLTGCRSVGPPTVFGPAMPQDPDGGTAHALVIDWGVTNSTPSAVTVRGFVIVDDDRQICLWVARFATTFTLPAGAGVGMNLTIRLYDPANS
jgi:hypothetical protein